MAMCIYHMLSLMNNVSHFLKWISDLARLEPRALEPPKLVSIPQVTQPPFIPLDNLANHVSQPTSGLPQTEPDPPIKHLPSLAHHRATHHHPVFLPIEPLNPYE